MTAMLRSPDGQTILVANILKIGRASDNDFVSGDPRVSAHHAIIRPHWQGHVIVDVGSTNGTFLNGQRLLSGQERVLASGDTIRIGSTTYTYFYDYDADTIRVAPDAAPNFSAPPPTTGVVHSQNSENDDNVTPRIKYEAVPPLPPPPLKMYSMPESQEPQTPIQPPMPIYSVQDSQLYTSQDSSILPSNPYVGVNAGINVNASNTSKQIYAKVSSERIQFTAFYPKLVEVDIWQTLLVYAHIESVLASVRADAARFMTEMGPLPGETSTRANVPLLRGTEITIVPTCSGITFTPERVVFKWVKDWHPTMFRLQVDGQLAGSAGNGEIAVYAGPLLIATLKIALLFEQAKLLPIHSPYANQPVVWKDSVTEVSARLYKQIFTSYSHDDTPVILACKNVYKALGYQVLMDIDSLQAGQHWNAALMKLIDESDIFQLFWSPRSAQSQFVRQEWEYALQHNKGEGFIRPVYWKKPLMPPPTELEAIHFAYLQLPGLRIADYGRLFTWKVASIFRRYE